MQVLGLVKKIDKDLGQVSVSLEKPLPSDLQIEIHTVEKFEHDEYYTFQIQVVTDDEYENCGNHVP